TNAWGKSLDPDKSSGIRFLGDASGEFTRAFDVEFPAAPLLGTNRSKRYAVVTEDGKVKSVSIEPDNIGADVSTAEKILG
ncbi:Peroxisomal membrane associated protein, partial [Lachnellula willkommii]